MNSIYLFSERSKKCIELQIPASKSSGFESLQSLLPKSLRGISLTKPKNNSLEELQYYKETREPYLARYLTDVSEKLIHLGQSLGALKLLEWASGLEKSPRVALVHAWAKLGLGKLDDAERDLSIILKWHPRHFFAHHLMGRVCFQRNDHQKAQEYFDRSLQWIEKDSVYEDLLTAFAGFNQIILDRDQLYSRDLTARELLQEIETLKNRASGLKKQVNESVTKSELQGLLVYLDGMEKLFESWLVEISARAEKTAS